MFIFEMLMPNGATANYHKALKFEIHETAIHAVINSYHSQEMDIISWQDTYEISIEGDIIKSLDDVEAVLANHPASSFYGAVIVPNETATVESAKARRWGLVKYKRTLVLEGGFSTAYGTFDSTESSRINIGGAASGAFAAKAASKEFSITWVLKDNTTVTLDADGMIEVGFDMLQFINSCFAKSQTLRELVDAATTVEEVNAIDIDSIWSD